MTRCPSCHGTASDPVLSLPGVPVLINALAASERVARATPVGDIDLAVCRGCGLVFNHAFDPDRIDYVADYENALHHSASFQAFADELVADLVRRHDLRGRRIVEIGCGDGFMLSRFIDAGVGEGVGYDPSMKDRESAFARSNMRIVPDYFSADAVDASADAVVCRHVLEHLPEPALLLRALRMHLGERDAVVYLEVPNADWVLRSASVWDVIYEHVTYWTPPAIESLLRRTGFEPIRIRQGYGDQFLMVEARPGEADPAFVPSGVEEVLRLARWFGDEVRRQATAWQARLGAQGGRVAVWGAGSKGLTFANMLSGGADTTMVAMVDLNPRKHGHFAPGTAIPIVRPEQLVDIRPDVVLAANSLYEAEIRERLTAMGLAPKLWSIAGASLTHSVDDPRRLGDVVRQGGSVEAEPSNLRLS